MNLPIIQKKHIFVSLSSLAVVASIVAYFVWGLSLGIDFTGGSLMEVKFNGQSPDVQVVRTELEKIEVKSLTVQSTDQNGLILRFQNSDEKTHQAVLAKLRDLAGSKAELQATKVTAETDKGQAVQVQTVDENAPALEELSYEAVGPSIGKELRRNAIVSLIIVAVLIIMFVAWAFRKVSRPVSAWKYGLAGVLALFHDVFIVIGIFSFLGHYYGIEVNTPFVAALLMVFGYSINDTIVVFDRVRENLPKSDLNFEGTVNKSVNQTMKRSIYTSATVMLTLLAIIFFGGASVRYFALALFIGIFFGTYSSIFLASPLLVYFEKFKKA